MDLNVKGIKDLVRLLNGTDLVEIEVQSGDYRVRLRRNVPRERAGQSDTAAQAEQGYVRPAAPHPTPLPSPGEPAPSPAENPAAASAARAVQPSEQPRDLGAEQDRQGAMIADRERYAVVVAPMVGTFHRSPSPGAPAYVEVGDEVEPGQPVCVIEAMKLMNEIEAEESGKVVEVFAENAQPVEYGQVLFVLERRRER